MLWTLVPHFNIIAPQFVLQNQIEFICEYEILVEWSEFHPIAVCWAVGWTQDGLKYL